MLKIIFGETPNSVYRPSTYFNNQYEDWWITDPLSIEMIKDVDKSDVLSESVIMSPVFGSMPVTKLSGGVKTLMLMAFDDSGKIFNASACGDNCAKWIAKIGEMKDLTINLHHIMDFSSVDSFRALIVNSNKIVHRYETYYCEAVKLKGVLRGGYLRDA